MKRNYVRRTKSYVPREALVDFVQEWLQLHRKRDMLLKEGKDITPEEKERIRELDRKKVYVLDKVLFPAMADLIYFFEALAVSKKMSEAFDEDVKELLDPGRTADAAKFSGNNMRMSYMQFRNNNLARLVVSMLGIHTSDSDKEKHNADFRVALMYQLLNIVGDMMDHLISNQYSFGNQIWRSAYDDYTRMKGWLALLAGTTENQNEEYDRKIGFLPIWYSNKADLASYEL